MKEQIWDYEVELVDLETNKFHKTIREKKAVIEKETGRVLGLVSPRYQLIQNKEIYNLMDNIKNDLNLKLTDIETCANKSITIFTYKFNDEINKVVKNSFQSNDQIKFGIELINSFNSNYGAPKMRAYAERLVCTNGMTMPKEISQFPLKYLFNRGSFEDTKSYIFNKINSIYGIIDTWESWASIIPDENKVKGFIAEYFSKKTGEILVEEYNAQPHKNLWSFYNVLTSFLTHDVTSRDIDKLRIKKYQIENVVNKLYKESLI